MGNSFVSLEEKIPDDKQNAWLGQTYGFWAKDGPLIDWFTALAETIAAEQAPPAWLSEVGAYWSQLDELSGAGYVPDRLKEYAADVDRKAVLIELASRAMQRALDHGGDYYRAFGSTLPKCSCGECPEPSLALGQKVGFLEVGSQFIRLLCGFTKHGEASSNTFGTCPDAASFARLVEIGGDPEFWRK